MPTLDLKRQFKELYRPSAKEVTVIEVPPLSFIMIDGSGDPNTSQGYADAIGALYVVAYTAKFALKKATMIDYPVMPLEGLWWTDDMAQFSADAKDAWHWTMMIMQPDIVTHEVFAAARREAMSKKQNPVIGNLRLAPFHEGLAGQIMHFGPYAAEAPTIARLHAFIAEQGYTCAGKHHEIYLSDPRKAAPERMRTIIRQPIRRALRPEAMGGVMTWNPHSQ